MKLPCSPRGNVKQYRHFKNHTQYLIKLNTLTLGPITPKYLLRLNDKLCSLKKHGLWEGWKDRMEELKDRRQKNVWKDEWMKGRMVIWRDGMDNGQIAGLMDGWMKLISKTGETINNICLYRKKE